MAVLQVNIIKKQNVITPQARKLIFREGNVPVTVPDVPATWVTDFIV
jgi:hypothetical protein